MADMDIQISIEDVNAVMQEDENVLLKLKVEALKRLLSGAKARIAELEAVKEAEHVVSPDIPAQPANGRKPKHSSSSSNAKD